MGAGDRLGALRSGGVADAARLVYRKAIYRKIVMGRQGALVKEHIAPARPLEPHLRLEVVGADRFGEVVGTNPHLSEGDVARFTANPSSCILIWDGDTLASSSWMTRGEVYVHELQRTLFVPEGEHFSCRSWVDVEYRGLSLFSHMIWGYAQLQPPDDDIWGLVYPRNVASIASLARVGWQISGHYWTRYLFGIKTVGEERFPPRPNVIPATAA